MGGTEAGGDAEAEAALPPAGVSQVLDPPLVLGPKTFASTGDVYKYFSALLAGWTMYQNCNEVRSCGDRVRVERTRAGSDRQTTSRR